MLFKYVPEVVWVKNLRCVQFASKYVNLANLMLISLIQTERLQYFNPYSAGIDFSRQHRTSVDVRF